MSRARQMLEEAAEAVDGDRNRDYGQPEINHTRTAVFWRDYVYGKYGVIVPVTAEDVCWMNALQKISREMHSANDDGPRDVAGFAANVAEIRGSI